MNLSNILKYLLEGVAVAISVYLIPKNKLKINELTLIVLTATASFAILDFYTPYVGTGMRQGAGLGIGFQQVGFGPNSEN